MNVVSDTSPLNYLVLIGLPEVLPQLFKEVHTPLEVVAELRHPRTPEIVRQWAGSPPQWLKVTHSAGTVQGSAHFGVGEVAAIALAKQLGAKWLLMDERDGSRFARAQGLRTIGTLAVLEQGARRGLLDLNDALTRLRQTSFRISLPLIRAALERDAAKKSPGE